MLAGKQHTGISWQSPVAKPCAASLRHGGTEARITFYRNPELDTFPALSGGDSDGI